MQEETTLKIEPGILQLVESDHQNAENVLKKYLERHFETIQGLLFNYHYDKRERVYDLAIDTNSLIFNGTKGSFKVLYTIGFFNACADLDYNATEEMKIDFTIDKESSEILLKGEYWPERGQDEI